MEKEQKKKLFIGAAILVLLLILGLIFYNKGRKTVTIAKLPVDDTGSGSSGSNSVGDSVVSQAVTEMYNDMKGLNLFGYHDEAPYQTLMTFSDTDFVKAYNFFNTKYQVQEGGGLENTFTAWLKAEKAIPYSPFDTVKAAILARLGKLNLP